MAQSAKSLYLSLTHQSAFPVFLLAALTHLMILVWLFLARDVMGLSAVCDCGISFSYSLTFFQNLVSLAEQAEMNL